MKDNSVKEIIFENATEGPITNVQCDKDFVVYSTANRVRVIHYEKKQKICMIEIPERYSSFPEYIYSSKIVRPTIMWRKLKIAGESNESDLLIIQWMNLIKVCRVSIN